MILPTVYLAAEDRLGLAVGRKLIAEKPPLTVYREENASGFAKLRKKAPNYAEMGRQGFPVLALTDLDNLPCAPRLLADWLDQPIHPNFLLRVCVREVEAWLMGDTKALAELLRLPAVRIPAAPEVLPDPKATLISLAQRAPRKIREAITPIGSASIGPGYNQLLSAFVADSWSPHLAAEVCPSLARARKRIAELAQRVIV